jgi:hypothetical protein
MELLKSGNVILRLLLELCVLVVELVIFAAGVAALLLREGFCWPPYTSSTRF